MQFWVYLLRCSDGSYYVGHSENLEARLWQHQQGLGSDWTKRRRPVELVWCGGVPTREEALACERRIKSWTRAKKEALIASDWDRISWLARPPGERASITLTNGRKAANSPDSPERSAQPAIDGRSASPSGRRPSTSLRTYETGERQ
jgi:putative endonuclease